MVIETPAGELVEVVEVVEVGAANRRTGAAPANVDGAAAERPTPGIRGRVIFGIRMRDSYRITARIASTTRSNADRKARTGARIADIAARPTSRIRPNALVAPERIADHTARTTVR